MRAGLNASVPFTFDPRVPSKSKRAEQLSAHEPPTGSHRATSSSAVTVEAANIGQAAAVKVGRSAVIGAGVEVGPGRAVIVAAASPYRVWQSIVPDNWGRIFA